ncbi:MAG TPA: DUF2442 domain-containing protein [Terracidiphilus sp.]|nr:DUF2442 domain-containing protein [Terracidiphilus sp.]
MDPHREFEEANRRAREFDAKHPKAVSARYDQSTGNVVLHLSNGRDFAFPAHDAQGLEQATPVQLSAIEISPSGYGIHFPKLDADLSVPSLLEGIFGSKKWLSQRNNAPSTDTSKAHESRPRVKLAV